MTLHSLTSDGQELVARVVGGIPEILWFGEPLSGDLDSLSALSDRPIQNASLETLGAPTVLPTEADGWPGLPGITGQRPDGSGWSPRFSLAEQSATKTSLTCTAQDDLAQLCVTTTIGLSAEGVATVDVTVHNTGSSDYILTNLALTIPLAPSATEVIVPEGRWVHEFQEVRLPLRVGAVELVNRRGRTSHDKPPWIFAGEAGFSNERGTVTAAHLGWSGNAAVRAEVLTDGRRVLQLGEVLLGDELRIEPDGSYASPTVYLACSTTGMNGASQAFHSYLRARPGHPSPTKPRPIHMNTWEAVYFDHDLETLSRLADVAAEVGAERYVLDDGWFGGRRGDAAGLGDWWVSADVWPDGLNPLVEHVTGLGMEFGIWVEPEMVNPDSDLYRAHPDWALGVPDYEPIHGRNQLVLDLTNPEVWDYLFGHLDRLLADHDVSYVKWDMNRDLTQPASGNRAASHDQTLAVYRLIDAIRAAHPGVDIESCSSGGARTDYGILSRTDRVWTSDSNDANERQRIQRGFLRFFPPEVMGAHIGPGRSHTSGRQHSLGFRATTAFMGHLGIEWNLLDATEEERAMVRDALTLHKTHRQLLHTGTVWQVDATDPGLQIVGVVAKDRSEAIFSVAQVEMARYGTPERMRMPGLLVEADYTLDLVLLADSKLGLATRQPNWVEGGIREASGDQLATYGLQLPALDPESAVLIHVRQR